MQTFEGQMNLGLRPTVIGSAALRTPGSLVHLFFDMQSHSGNPQDAPMLGPHPPLDRMSTGQAGPFVVAFSEGSGIAGRLN